MKNKNTQKPRHYSPYYEMKWNSVNMEQWVLGDVTIRGSDFMLYHDSPEILKSSNPIPVETHILEKGKCMDISYNYGAWVISSRIANIIKDESISGLRLNPCLIDGEDMGYFAMFIINTVDCLDYEKSDIDYYSNRDVEDAETVEDREIMKNRIGKIKGLYDFYVIPEKIPPLTHLFTVKCVDYPTVVSHRLMECFKEISTTGVYFRACS